MWCSDVVMCANLDWAYCLWADPGHTMMVRRRRERLQFPPAVSGVKAHSSALACSYLGVDADREGRNRVPSGGRRRWREQYAA